MATLMEVAVKDRLHLTRLAAEGDSRSEAILEPFIALELAHVFQPGLVGDAAVPVGVYLGIAHLDLVQIGSNLDVLCHDCYCFRERS